MKARTIKGVGRWYAWHGSGMSRKMEGYKGGGKEREGGREMERDSAGFPGTDADTLAREAVMRY